MQYNAVAFLEGLFHIPNVATEERAQGAAGGLGRAPAISDPDSLVSPLDLPPEWHFLWDERAAIMEYEGKMPKEHAEAAALTDILRRMKTAGVAPFGTARIHT